MSADSSALTVAKLRIKELERQVGELEIHTQEALSIASNRLRIIRGLKADLIETQRHNGLLREVAERAEWGALWDGESMCPICNMEEWNRVLKKTNQHEKDCPYRAAIDGGALETAVVAPPVQE